MDLMFKFSQKQLKKIIKDSANETLKDFVYEYGQSKETTKKLFEVNNSLLLGLLQSSNINNDYQSQVIENMDKNIKKQEIIFILLYLYTSVKFIALTTIFGCLLFAMGNLTDKLHKYIQDFIFSVVMIIYSACLYKFIGDEFMTLIYTKDFFNYTKRKFNQKRFLVKSNLNLKNMIETGRYDYNEEIKNQVIKITENNDTEIRKWEKL